MAEGSRSPQPQTDPKLTGRTVLRWYLAREAAHEVLYVLAEGVGAPKPRTFGEIRNRAVVASRWVVLRRLNELGEMGLLTIEGTERDRTYCLSPLGKKVAAKTSQLDSAGDQIVVPAELEVNALAGRRKIGTRSSWRDERDLSKIGPDYAPRNLRPLKINQVEYLALVRERGTIDVIPSKWRTARGLARRELLKVVKDNRGLRVSLTAAGRDVFVALWVKDLARILPNDIDGRGNRRGGRSRGLGEEIQYQASIAKADNGGAILDRLALKELREKHSISLAPSLEISRSAGEVERISWSQLGQVLEALQ